MGSRKVETQKANKSRRGSEVDRRK